VAPAGAGFRGRVGGRGGSLASVPAVSREVEAKMGPVPPRDRPGQWILRTLHAIGSLPGVAGAGMRILRHPYTFAGTRAPPVVAILPSGNVHTMQSYLGSWDLQFDFYESISRPGLRVTIIFM
jgi:hypothetical protein